MPLEHGSSRAAFEHNLKAELDAGKPRSQALAIAYRGAGQDAAMKAAGVICRAPDGALLFLQRGADGDHAGAWCWPGGVTEDGEDAEQTARRELAEETGHGADGEFRPVDMNADDALAFTTFLHDVPERFEPVLNEEHTDWIWATPEEAPEPLHPGVAATLAAPGLLDDDGEDAAMDAAIGRDPIAMDRSVRSYDHDGRLKVEVANISKANVCPYYGREIPGWEELGLDPDKTYQMLRDPEELRKAAPTANEIQLLSIHKPVSTDQPQKQVIAGTLGSNAEFNDPYLQNSLTVWDGEAIKAIESEEKKELSSGYHYRPDMTPGTFKGVRYDGVMRDIKFNHVALVVEGRAGTDVVVGDSKEQLNMTKPVLTRKAVLVQGALAAFLRPKLAQDAQIDVAPILKGLGAKNFAARKAGIIAAVKEATKGKLAQDADIDDLTTLLDALQGEEVGQDAETEANSAVPVKEKDDESDAEDEDDEEEEEANKKAEAKDRGAKDRRKGARDSDKVEGTERDPEMVTKGAMDAAIAEAVKQAQDQAAKTQRAIREAEKVVRPYVGELALAQDSAEGVYRTALKMLNVQGADTIHASALPALLAAQPLPDRRPKQPTVALDAAKVKSFADRFPGAAEIRTL